MNTSSITVTYPITRYYTIGTILQSGFLGVFLLLFMFPYEISYYRLGVTYGEYGIGRFSNYENYHFYMLHIFIKKKF